MFGRPETPFARSAAGGSDRHTDDVLVRLDHAVAHGDHGLQRDLGIVDGGNDLEQVGLLRRGLCRELLRPAQLLHRILPDLAKELGEAAAAARLHAGRRRSEEHTSELQSLMRTSYAVFCLKKKKNN